MWYTLVAHAAAQAPLPLAPDARFAVALFCDPTCPDEVVDTLDAGLSSIAAKNGFPDSAPRPLRVMGIAGTDFGIPDAAFVALYGVGVDRPEALAKSQEVLIAWFASPRDRAGETLAVAHAAFAAAAKQGGGWVEDLDTQRVYGAESWAALDPAGPITDWFVVDAAPLDVKGGDDDGALRLVTRGLRRYGDFELVVDDVPADAGADVSTVINALAESLRTRATVPASLTLESPTVRGTASLKSTPRREDDPEEPLLAVTFEGEITLPVAGVDAAAVDPVEGDAAVPPPVSVADASPPATGAPTRGASASDAAQLGPRGPTDLEEAQRLAFERFDRVVAPAIQAGLPAAEAVAVKVPFPTRSGSVEYMWVELTSVRGDDLSGTLLNTPRDVDGLAKGDPITLRRAEMFDYVWKKADGTREGNTTARFVR